jgi:Fe2+ or Zn2+ uptake regulation protein
MIETANLLKTHEIKPSLTRMMILDYLAASKTHPNVDEIYQALQPKIPTLSKTTVYNTLHLFISKSLARSVLLQDNEQRFDLASHPHAHFQCNVCHQVFDADFVPDLDLAKSLSKHKIEDISLLLLGVCENCQNDSKNDPNPRNQ